MEFVGKECYLCGKKFGNRKPKDTVAVDPFTFNERRIVCVVAPCPFCEEKVPVWGGTDVIGGPEPEAKPEPGPEENPKEKPEPEPEENPEENPE